MSLWSFTSEAFQQREGRIPAGTVGREDFGMLNALVSLLCQGHCSETVDPEDNFLPL